jgi:hypothetical protein
MKARGLRAVVSLLGMAAIVATASADIRIRVSVKVVNDATGNRPLGGDLCDDAQIQAKIDAGNEILAQHHRALQLDLIEIVDLVGLPAPPAGLAFCDGGSNQGEYCTDPVDCPGGTCVAVNHWFDLPIHRNARNALQAAAQADYGTFAWNENAINIYIVGTHGSGTADFDMVLLGQDLAYPNTPFHEIGHFLNLCHTHGCEFGGSSTDEFVIGDDEVDDTLRDNSHWDTHDEIANALWGVPWASLPPDSQQAVDDVLHNLMSYHIDRTRMTAGQLDRLTDYTNDAGSDVVSGRTHFVDWRGDPADQEGSSTKPYLTLIAALGAADPSGDVVLMRAGAYQEEGLVLDASIKEVALVGSGGTVQIAAP